ncbi:General stress protein 13, partial [Dysosmobacter welbionis]
DQTAADAHKGQHQQHDNAVPLIPHQRDVLPVRQKRRQHLGPIQRRDGNQIEQPQTDGQRRQRVQAEAEHHVHRRRIRGVKVNHLTDKHCQNRQHKVGDGSRQGGQCHALLGLSEVPGVHRHRLGPAESCHEHHQQADPVDVPQRIQTQAVHGFGR